MKAQTLLKQLEFIGAAIELNPVVPILECAYVDDGQLIGSNLRTTLICKTDIKGTFLFPFRALKKVVAILPKDVDCQLLKQPEYERVTLETSSGNFIFNDIPSHLNFPALPTRPEVELGVLNQLDLSTIAQVLTFAAKDALRPAVSAVYIGDQIAATDGHRLAWFDYSGVAKHQPLLIDTLTASVLSTFGLASVRCDGPMYVEFHSNKGQIIISRLVDERYYKNVIPSGFGTKVTIAKEALLTAISLGIQMANKTTHQILFDFKASNGLTVTAKDLDFDTKFEYNIPCAIHGADILISFNGVLLKSILGAVDDERITLKFTTPNKCGVVNDSFLLMPIMITEYA